MSLPISQHEKIWPVYIDFVEQHGSDALLSHVGHRLCILDKSFKEKLVKTFLSRKMTLRAMEMLIEMIDDEEFVSGELATKYDLVMYLLKVIRENADTLPENKCEQVFRHFLNKYSDEVGNMWVSFANYFIRRGMFEKARSIFEEALNEVKVSRDFGVVYNAYLRFEESVLAIVFEEGVGDESKEDLRQFKRVEEDVENLLDAEFGEGSQDIF